MVTEKGTLTRGGEPGEPLGQELDLSGDVPEWLGVGKSSQMVGELQ